MVKDSQLHSYKREKNGLQNKKTNAHICIYVNRTKDTLRGSSALSEQISEILKCFESEFNAKKNKTII